MAIKDWPGGVISKTPVVPSGGYINSTASGVWTLDQAAYWTKQQQWPGSAPADPYFYDVSLLLTGNGTNGAQNNTFLAANGAAQGPFADPAGYWSVGFDGSGDYLVSPTSSAWGFDTGDFTLECWVNLNSVATISALASNYSGSSWSLQWRSDTAAWTFNYGSSPLISYTNTPNIGVWNHIAVARSGTSLRMFLNGTQVASVTDSTNITSSSSQVYIGSLNASLQYTNGYISNVRVVKGTAVYTSNFTVPTSPLTAISGTSLLTCQNNVICDTSSNLFAITANGNAAVNNKSPFTISSTYNPYSFSGYFDGSGDYLSAASNAAFGVGTGDFTIEAWIYTADTSFMIGCCTATGGVGLGYNIDNGSQGLWLGRVGQGPDATSGVQLTYNTWHHVAVTRSGTSVKFFVDGVQSGSTQTVSTNYATGAFRVGADVSASFDFAGYISNFRLVKGTALYTANFTPSNEPLTAISGTSLLTCQSSTFVDNSPNNFTITVNGNTTVATASNSGLPITRNGNTTQGSFSPYGNLWSNYFDGSGDYLTTSSTYSNVGTGDFTAECWVYMPASLSQNYVFAATSGGVNFGILSGKVSFGHSYTADVLTGNTTVSLNTWNHIAVSRTSGTVRVFLNGVSDATPVSYTNSMSATTNYIGAIGAAGYAFAGYVSNARFVTSSLYTSNFTPSTTPLTAVSGTSLLTCQSNRFIDNSSNNFTLTVNGNTSVQRFSPFNPTVPYSAATIGGSGYFDGSGDYLNAGSQTAYAFGTGNFTVEAWIYPTATTGTYESIIDSRSSDNSPTGWDLGFVSNYVFVYNAGFVLASAAGSIPYNTWTHVAFVRNGSTITLYINGVSASSTSTSSNFTDSTLYIGANPFAAAQNFFGYISNARLVKGTAVYTTNFTPPTSPLTAVSGTSLLCNFTNAGIPDAAMMNDLETVGNAQVSTSVVKYGTGSLAFDGFSAYLSVPYNVTNKLPTGDWTIEFWMYCGGAQANSTSPIYVQDNTGNYSGIVISANASREVSFTLSYTGATWNVLWNTIGTYTDNTWNHVAVVRSGSSVYGFFNGALTATTSGVPTSLYSTTDATILGKYNAWYFNGYIDDLRITKGYARYTANFTPPTAAFPTF